VAHAVQRRIDVRRTTAHVFKKGSQLIFSHPIKWYLPSPSGCLCS
jgi:hypothetical protein